jgi:hypothetical protein
MSPVAAFYRGSSSVHADAQMAHRTRLPLQRSHVTDPSCRLTSPWTRARQTGRSVTYIEDWTHMLSFERSTRLRDNVGSQNGTVSDPAEGHTRPHRQRGGALQATPEGGLADPVSLLGHTIDNVTVCHHHQSSSSYHVYGHRTPQQPSVRTEDCMRQE